MQLQINCNDIYILQGAMLSEGSYEECEKETDTESEDEKEVIGRADK